MSGTGRRVLVAGCGYVGRRLAERLAGSGDTVFGLRRRAADAGRGWTAIRADLGDRAGLDALPWPFDAVVFAASPSSADEAGYREIFVEGLRNLIDAAASRSDPPRRLVFVSSTAVYGQSCGEWVDETSPTEPGRFNGRMLLEAETLVRAAPFEGSSVRLGGIYGPGRTRRIEQVRAGDARLDPGPPHYTNRIHVEDAAATLAHLLERDAVEPVYLGVDGDPAADNDVLRFLARELGLPDPPEADRPPRRRSSSKRCRNDRLRATGYRLAYPSYRDGYRALLAGER